MPVAPSGTSGNGKAGGGTARFVAGVALALALVNVTMRGEIKIIIPFTESIDVGKFVYHCYLLSHEDKGMMATVEVTPASGGYAAN